MPQEGSALPWPENGQSSVDRLEAAVGLLEGVNAEKLEATREKLKREIPAKEAELGLGHPEAVMAYVELGAVLMCLGDGPGSIEAARRALKGAEGEGGAGRGTHAAIAAAALLGEAHFRSGAPREAAVILEGALNSARAALGDNHPDTLNCANVLAMALRDTRRAGEAERLLEAALEGLKGHPEERGRASAMVRSTFGNMLSTRGLNSRAVKILRMAYEDMERLRGPDHEHTLTAATNLAGALLGAGRVKEALGLSSRAYSRLLELKGKSARQTRRAWNCMSQAMRADLKGGAARKH